MERGNNLKKEGREGLLLTFSLFCDFYQNTEIQHTQTSTKAQRSIYSCDWHCPPGQPPAGRGGRGAQPQQQGEETRQEETEGKTGGSRETERRMKLQEHAEPRKQAAESRQSGGDLSSTLASPTQDSLLPPRIP